MNKSRDTVKILDVNIDKVNMEQAMDKVRDFLIQKGCKAIFTPNSEIIMNAWVSSEDHNVIKNEMESIGEKLLDNKKQYLKVKELDENIFGDAFVVMDGDD